MADLVYWASNGPGYSATAPTENSAVILPKYYKPDATRRCVIAAHGLLGSAYGWRSEMAELRTFAALGFPVITADLGGPATWGNDTVQARITEAWNYMKLGWGVAHDGFVGYAQSMGGVALLNYMRAHPADMVALAGEVPVIGLDDTHDRDPLSLSGSIESAYGGLSAYNAAVATHDPYANMATHAALGIPTKFWVALDDPICSLAVALYFDAAGACDTVSIGTGGHRALPPEFYEQVGDFIRPYVFRQTPSQGVPAIRHTFGTADLVAA